MGQTAIPKLNNMHDKKKIYGNLIAIFILVALSALTAKLLHSFLACLLPISALFIIEAIFRTYFYFKRLKSQKKRQRIEKEQEAAKQPAQLITSISELLLKDFITCCTKHNYDVLGTGSEQEKRAAFIGLLSQYYEISKNESIFRELNLRKKLMLLEMRQRHISTMAAVLMERYSEAAADSLRKLFLKEKYTFSKETYKNDLEMVRRGEIRKQLEYERIYKQWAEMHDGNKKIDDKPEQQYANFIARLMDINKIEGVRYDMNTVTTMEFALGEARKVEYIKNLKNGTGQHK